MENLFSKLRLIDLIETKLISSEQSIITQWQSPVATSTRHFYVDDLLPADICSKIYDAFPVSGDSFYDRKSFRERKKTSANLAEFSKILSDITYAIQDDRVVNLISKFTHFDSLEPDKKLYAGGLSMMFKGDFLNPHIDNSHDMDRKLYRRLNALYYVTPNWGLDTGGNFELWDDDRLVPKTIHSKFNRFVVMETNKTSWHSVSPVLVDRARCCVSNYYFSKYSPYGSSYFHVTSFTGRPKEHFRRAYGLIDNGIRNLVSSLLGIGRGKNLVNKDNSSELDK
jgi:Rps23 Pro-64 3,4-dihydroxylase Tpa1-like proline 4-hydroxylase